MKVIWKSVLSNYAARFSLLSFALFIFFQAEAQEIIVTGTVVDKSSNPISNVNISLDAAQISTVTDEAGNFSLIRNTTGTTDLIQSEQLKCSFDGRKLMINSIGQKVSISIYEMSGRLLTHILNPTRLSGKYISYPSAYLSSNQPLIYILRVSMDNYTMTYKLIKYNDIQYSKGLELISRNIPPGFSHQSKKSTNTIDTLILIHSSYMIKKIPISEYLTNVGTVQLEDILIPAPTSLTADAVSASQIDLGWTDNANNENGFRIERSPDGSTGWTQIARVGANITSYQNTGLSATTSYSYRVYAYNTEDSSYYSNIANATTSALNYSFNGGTLEDLKAVSPELIFGTLTINGYLIIPSSDSAVVFTVENMRINEMVLFPYPVCSPYDNAPNITINATGTVWVDGPISLYGKWGTVVASEVTCSSCQGTDGGDFTINSDNIYVNSYIHTYGGDGSYSNPGTGVLCGCNAGDGGHITLNATSILDINAGGSNLKLEGGDGGNGFNCIRGTDGTNGLLNFEGQTIEIEEINLGSTEFNMYDYNAQLLDYEKMTVSGHCAYREEFDHRNDDGTWYIYLGFANVDWIEDIYLLYSTEDSIKIDLTAADPLADLDIFLTTTSGKILDSGKGPTSTESINYELADPGYYWIWVSYVDDGMDRSTDYTLKFKQ